MKRIDFYILKQQTQKARLPFVCRILDKAYQQDHSVHVLSSSSKESEHLDDLLWTFNDISFIPHIIVEAHTNPLPAPIQISDGFIPETANDILLNLSSEIPSRWEQFSRIIEVIVEEEPYLKQGRNKFAFYRKHHLTPETHAIQN